MPIRHAVMHFIDKKPDGSPAALHMASASLPESGAIENLMNDVNEATTPRPARLGASSTASPALPSQRVAGQGRQR